MQICDEFGVSAGADFPPLKNARCSTCRQNSSDGVCARWGALGRAANHPTLLRRKYRPQIN
jgi:hypothetical protein